jgi:tripartite-type tricarboxylate transporter receptor subunit TctC
MLRRSLLLATLATPALAQARTLRLIVPFPPGGTVDILAAWCSRKWKRASARPWWSRTAPAPAA